MERDRDNLILFDGLCNLCTRSVQFVIRHDRRVIFKFASLQSDLGQEICRQNDLDCNNLQTFLLIDRNRIFIRSDAAIEVVRRFGGMWSIAAILKIVPRIFRDWLYDLIARNRYRWFGKRDQCLMPTEEIKSRFL